MWRPVPGLNSDSLTDMGSGERLSSNWCFVAGVLIGYFSIARAHHVKS